MDQQAGKIMIISAINYTSFYINLFCLVEIKNKKVIAPTPQNTPINTAPISSQSIPAVPSISEEIETISTPGK